MDCGQYKQGHRRRRRRRDARGKISNFLPSRASHRRLPAFRSFRFPLLRMTPHRGRILREEFSATRSRWYPEGNLLTRSKFSSRKSFEKSHPEFKGKPFIWDLQYGSLSRLRYDILRRFIRSPFSLLLTESRRSCIVTVSVQRMWIWVHRTISFSEAGNISSRTLC